MNKKVKDNYFIYRFLRPVIKVFIKVFYRPTYIGLENVPKDGPIILAGNHTSNLDCLLLISCIKRSIHFLAKIELFRGFKKILFANAGLIPVDRVYKTTKPLEEAEEYLNIGAMVLIFTEGTKENGNGLLKFKTGTVRLASKTNTKVVPFIINNEFKMFRKSITIEFLKPITITDDVLAENDRLRGIIASKFNG